MPPAYLKSLPVLPSVAIPYWCAGKEQFESAVIAAEVAGRDGKKHRDIYRCRLCGTFHLGSSRNKPRASKAAAAELIRSR